MSDPMQSNPLFALFALWGRSAFEGSSQLIAPNTRTSLVPVIKDLLSQHNPWECTSNQLAPIDLLLLVDPNYVSVSDLKDIFALCFSHPSAPPASEWGSRPSPVKVGPYKNEKVLPWIHAMARSSVASACVEEYASRGGRLDVFDVSGHGPLACLAENEKYWDAWFCAAQRQGVNLLSFEQGTSYAVAWRQNQELTGTTLSQKQKTIASLVEKYPVSSDVPDALVKWSQWLDLLRSAPGQRALLTNLRISGCLELLQSNPDMQRQALDASLVSFASHGDRLRWAKSSVRQSLMSSITWLFKILDAGVSDPDVRTQFDYVRQTINASLTRQSLSLLSSSTHFIDPGASFQEQSKRNVDWLEYVFELVARPQFKEHQYLIELVSSSVSNTVLVKELLENIQQRPHLLLALMTSPSSLSHICAKAHQLEPKQYGMLALAVSAFMAHHLKGKDIPYQFNRMDLFEDLKSLASGSSGPFKNKEVMSGLERGFDSLRTDENWDQSLISDICSKLSQSQIPLASYFYSTLSSVVLQNELKGVQAQANQRRKM